MWDWEVGEHELDVSASPPFRPCLRGTPGRAAAVVAGAARSCLGITLSDEEAAEAAGHPLSLIGKAFRKGRPAARALRALRGLKTAAGVEQAAGPGPTLEDLPGMGEAAEWGLQLAVDLPDWKAGKVSWSDVDRGILLSGPPGCGKTSFATALARTCGTPIVLGSLGRWQAMGHMGDCLKAMRRAFSEAAEAAPCILFVDEVDSFGDRERLASSSNEQYCREVINAFLECLDGAEGREGVVVVGATNYPDALDAGIRRPGRLDRHIAIPLPNAEARMAILKLHLGSDPGGALALAATRTEGWSGARLEQLAREARRKARKERRAMDVRDLIESFPPLLDLPDDVRRRSAVHEAGHAIVGVSLGQRVVEVSVAATVEDGFGTSEGGHTIFDDPNLPVRTSAWYCDRIATLLAGIAAEEAVLESR